MTRLTIITEIVAPYRIPVFNALAERGMVEPHVIFLAENDVTQRQWRVESERIRFSFEILASWRKRVGGTMLLLNRGVESALERARPDVILAGGYNYPAMWQAQRWARRAHVPFVLWSESNLGDQRAGGRLREWLKRRFVRQCQGFLVPGTSASEYLQSYGVAKAQVETAPNAVDNERFAALAAEALRAPEAQLRQRLGLPARYFLYVGRLVREKGIFELVNAYAALPKALRERVGLVFAGDGPQRVELQQAVAKVAGGNIVWKGFAQQEDLPAYYALAEALILPTWSDPWGLVVNEAMACSTPAIVSQVAGCRADLILEAASGRTGWAMAPHDEVGLRFTMEKLILDPQISREVGECAARHIQRYSPAAWAAGVERLACKFAHSFHQGS